MPEGPAAKRPEFNSSCRPADHCFEPQLTIAGASPPFFSLLVWKNLHFHRCEAEMHAWICCTDAGQPTRLAPPLLSRTSCHPFLLHRGTEATSSKPADA